MPPAKSNDQVTLSAIHDASSVAAARANGVNTRASAIHNRRRYLIAMGGLLPWLQTRSSPCPLAGFTPPFPRTSGRAMVNSLLDFGQANSIDAIKYPCTLATVLEVMP